MLTRRQFLRIGTATLGAGAAAGLYGWRIEPHWPELVRRSMPLANLPTALAGKTLLHLSDIHVGVQVDTSYLVDALRDAFRLAPDFVAVTGDFLTWSGTHDYDGLARVLEHLPHGRLATVAALGNHDYGPGWQHRVIVDRLTSVIEAADVVVLRNASVTAGGLRFVGLADFWSPEFGVLGGHPLAAMFADDDGPELIEGFPRQAVGARDLLRQLPPGPPTVILAHNPDAQDAPIWSGVEGWVLAGHTHGGQVKPPFLPPPVIPCRNKRYTAGAFDVGPGRTLYINRGLGHLLRVRFNVRPEITLFTLEPAARR